MKRNVKPTGSGGRLRLTLLLASIAAFILVPVAVASAATGVVKIKGTGAGKLVPVPGQEAAAGTPAIECSYASPGPAAGTCSNTAASEEGVHAIKVKAVPAPGSELVEWKVLKGTKIAKTCEASNPETVTDVCGVITFNPSATLEIEAVFDLEPVKDVHITIEGSGSGKVVGTGGTPGDPKVNCNWNGETTEQTGVCDTTSQSSGGVFGILVESVAAPGSQFTGWTVDESKGGFPVGCEEPLASTCGVIKFEESEEINIKATFAEVVEYPLNLTTSGNGSGSFKCKVNGGPQEACKATYIEGDDVTVVPQAGTGSKFVVFSGDCSGASCELEMNEEKSVDAQFDLESVLFSVSQTGEGSVQCEDNGGGLGVCASSYLYGHTIKVVATPAPENELASLTGTGSASGCSTSSCEFAITSSSSVTVEFLLESTKDEKEGEVFGEVPQTTSLESECASVDLGEFIPGVEDDYSNTCGLVLTSTGVETELSAEDESATHTGHLVQGSYFLPSALKTKATDSEAKGTGPGLTALTSPVTLLTFPEPISKDAATLEFNQHIGAHDGLHTGVYAKVITLTLEQTTP